jgi:hypothetical protein
MLSVSKEGLCACVCIPYTVARQRLGIHVPAAKNIRNSRRIVELLIFYAVLVVSKANRRVVLPRPSCILILDVYVWILF